MLIDCRSGRNPWPNISFSFYWSYRKGNRASSRVDSPWHDLYTQTCREFMLIFHLLYMIELKLGLLSFHRRENKWWITFKWLLGAQASGWVMMENQVFWVSVKLQEGQWTKEAAWEVWLNILEGTNLQLQNKYKSWGCTAWWLCTIWQYCIVYF